jgi:hypothetical protein
MRPTKFDIIIKCATLGIVILLVSVTYTTFFYQNDLKSHSDLVQILQSIDPEADVLYVAESSNTATHKDDVERKTISEFINDELPDQKVDDLTKPAAHAGIYKYLLRRIPENNKIKTVIITLNLRSFNAQWIHSSLETSLQKSLVFIRPYPPIVNRFLLSFKDYPIKSKKEQEDAFRAKWVADEFHFPYDFPHKNVKIWDQWMANRGILNKDSSRNQPLTELACHYIKAYGFQIDTLTNPRIKDFNDIIDFAQEKGWKLYFNLLAENIDKADQLVGQDLTFLMTANRDLLVGYFSNKGVVVIDNLETVKDSAFIDQHWTTEHYNDNGRKAVAKKVADAIKKSF